jgi:nucleotide-binding universal stress UspA family protein
MLDTESVEAARSDIRVRGGDVTTPLSGPAATGRATENHSIVVGVDPQGRSAGAVVWAVDHAQRSSAEVRLVSATAGRPDTDPTGGHDLGTLAHRLGMGNVTQRAQAGPPVDVLLDSLDGAGLLVVGCRSMPHTQRLLVGSTSRGVAAWCPVPVVIVPEAWIQPALASAPVVVGLKPAGHPAAGHAGAPDRQVLDFAFATAAQARVPLIVVSAFEPAWLQAWSPGHMDGARAEAKSALERQLERWQRSYPDVEVVANSVAEPAGKAITEASRIAQLTVVGRHASPALTGTLGSTARAVLHHVTRPVALVPHGRREHLQRELARARTLGERPWGPML